MLDHVGIKVKSVARAKAFYDAALRPLGLTPQYDFAVPATKKRFVLLFGGQGLSITMSPIPARPSSSWAW